MNNDFFLKKFSKNFNRNTVISSDFVFVENEINIRIARKWRLYLIKKLFFKELQLLLLISFDKISFFDFFQLITIRIIINFCAILPIKQTRRVFAFFFFVLIPLFCTYYVGYYGSSESYIYHITKISTILPAKFSISYHYLLNIHFLSQ